MRRPSEGDNDRKVAQVVEPVEEADEDDYDADSDEERRRNRYHMRCGRSRPKRSGTYESRANGRRPTYQGAEHGVSTVYFKRSLWLHRDTISRRSTAVSIIASDHEDKCFEIMMGNRNICPKFSAVMQAQPPTFQALQANHKESFLRQAFIPKPRLTADVACAAALQTCQLCPSLSSWAGWDFSRETRILSHCVVETAPHHSHFPYSSHRHWVLAPLAVPALICRWPWRTAPKASLHIYSRQARRSTDLD